MGVPARWRWWWISGLCSLVLGATLAPAGRAFAQSGSLSVLGLVSEDGDDALASAVTRAIRRAAEDEADFEVSDARVSLPQMTMAQDCEIGDAQCRIAVAKALGADSILYGSLRRQGSRSYEVEAHLAKGRDGTERSATQTFPARDTSEAAFARVARVLLAELRGETPEHEQTEPAPAVATVAPDVQPLGEPPAESVPSVPPEQEARAASNDWIGYTLIGVAVLSAGFTGYSWMQINSANQDGSLNEYRMAVPSNLPDACDEALNGDGSTYGVSAQTLADTRSACRKGRTFEVLQYVFLGVTLASAGVGTYFLLDDETPQHAARPGPALALSPRASLHGAALNMKLTF